MVRFCDFSDSLPPQDVFAVLLQATNTVIAQLSTHGDGFIYAEELKYVWAQAQLILFTGENLLNWTAWGMTLKGLTNFVAFFRPVSLVFDILSQEDNIIGTGTLGFIDQG